jgi:hypothetical protein
MGQPLSDVSSRGHVDSLSTASPSPKTVSISSLLICKRARTARESAALACPSKKIAPEDGLLVPKGSVRGRGPATQVRAINYVVMQQGCHMESWIISTICASGACVGSGAVLWSTTPSGPRRRGGGDGMERNGHRRKEGEDEGEGGDAVQHVFVETRGRPQLKSASGAGFGGA